VCATLNDLKTHALGLLTALRYNDAEQLLSRMRKMLPDRSQNARLTSEIRKDPMSDFVQRQARYAELLIQTGVNLQPDQALHIRAELEHAPFVRLLVAKAYDAGASYVDVAWHDAPSARARLKHAAPDSLDYFPDYEVARYQQMVDERWARLSLTGAAFPNIFEDVDPNAMRRTAVVRREKVKFYTDAIMSNQMQWCVAGVPTAAWANQIFPELEADAAMGKLWNLIFQVCRVDADDPVAAWDAHDRTLNQVVDFLAQHDVQELHFLDATPGPDGQPRTQLTIGMTDQPRWIAASSQTPGGVRFFANMPTEETFTTPHRLRTQGWVRTTKPFFPFERKVEGAWFRFEEGQVVAYGADQGEAVLDQFFAMDGARFLGEVALVDVRSPINQAGVLFYDTLFDENAVCHIAFGEAYPEGYVGAEKLDESEHERVGINKAQVHLDVMIGSPTLQVTASTADDVEIPIMRNGQFVDEALA
jgi:aminopeptidase